MSNRNWKKGFFGKPCSKIIFAIVYTQHEFDVHALTDDTIHSCHGYPAIFPVALLYKSHNTPAPYSTMHHFVTEMFIYVNIFVAKWCIVECFPNALWELWDGYAGNIRVTVAAICCYNLLTHWGRDKMAAIFQTTFSTGFPWMNIYDFRLKFHWNLFLGVQLTTFQHWFRWWLGADQATSQYLNQWWLVYWRIYASLGLNELIRTTTKQPISI